MCYADAWSALIIVPIGCLGLTFVDIGNPASFGKLATRPWLLRKEVTLSTGISRCQHVRYQVVIIDRGGQCVPALAYIMIGILSALA